jgi:phosphoribosylformylglycinamidine (FGAM) synthase-like enzyme
VELGGSLFNTVLGERGGVAPTMPAAPLDRYRALHRTIGDGLVRACHDLSEGGLAVALAEMCIAGRLGAAVALDALVNAAPVAAAIVPLLFAVRATVACWWKSRPRTLPPSRRTLQTWRSP